MVRPFLKHPDLKQAYDCLNVFCLTIFGLYQITTQILSVGSMFRSESWEISALMVVSPGSLILKVQKLLITSFLSVLGSKKTLRSLWDKLRTKARHLNPVGGDQIVDFITNLDQYNKMLLL